MKQRLALSQYLFLLQSPLVGFNLVDNVYDLGHNDRLHQGNRGVSEHSSSFWTNLYRLRTYRSLMSTSPGFPTSQACTRPAMDSIWVRRLQPRSLHIFKCIVVPLDATELGWLLNLLRPCKVSYLIQPCCSRESKSASLSMFPHIAVCYTKGSSTWDSSPFCNEGVQSPSRSIQQGWFELRQ